MINCPAYIIAKPGMNVKLIGIRYFIPVSGGKMKLGILHMDRRTN